MNANKMFYTNQAIPSSDEENYNQVQYQHNIR